MQIIHALQLWWHQQSWIELAGVLTGFLCVILAAFNSIWNWPIAIISVALYIYIFGNAQLYADMGLQLYFLVTNIYGWYFWSRRPDVDIKTPVVLLTSKQLIVSILIIVLITPSLGWLLIKLSPILHYKPASYPYLDSFCAACSFIAQFYLTRKILENWLLWIFVDIIYTGIYIVKGLEPTAIMYAGYVIIAILGYIDWKKDYKKQLQ